MTGPDAITDKQSELSTASMEALDLQHQPFTDAPVGGELFSDSTTTSLIADINTVLYGSDDVLLVLGAEGSGRSTLLRQLAASQKSRIACFSVKGSSRFDTAHLFGSVLEAFKTPVPPDLKGALDALIPNLQGTFERYNRLSTIVLDDAHLVPVEELTKLLSGALYLNGHEEPLLRVLLASTPEFEDNLPDALPQGAEIRYASLTIDPFDHERAENYLEFRLNQAGYFDDFPFSEKDTQSLLEHSHGYPGSLNKAAASQLNAEYGQLPESLLPPEFAEQRSNGGMVKMLLGGLACLMIAVGLFMSTQSDGERSPAARSGNGAADYRTIETVSVNPGNSETAELELVDPTPETTSTLIPEPKAGAGAELTPEPLPAVEPESAAQEPTPAPEPAPTPELAPIPEPEPAPRQEPAIAANISDDALLTNADDDDPAISTPTPTPRNSPVAVGVLESPTWILVQDPQQFTVQMSASTDRDSVESFMRRNDLPAPNSVFAFERNGDTWYALVHGLFSSVPEARNALKLLPEGALRNQPWIRRIGQVQNSLKDQN